MEKERERLREKEEELNPLTSYEYGFFHQITEREKIASLPRVFPMETFPLKFSGIHNALVRSRMFGYQVVEQRLTRAPLYTMSVSYHYMPKDAPRRGSHRHMQGYLFYITRGRGYEKQENGVEFDFEEGDVFVVPPFVTHQHFPDPKTGCEALVPKPLFPNFLGLSWMEQDEFGTNPKLPPGTDPIMNDQGEMIGFRIKRGYMGATKDIEVYKGRDARWDEVFKLWRSARPWEDRSPSTTYDHYLKLLAQENEELRTAPHVIKGNEIPWENTRQGRIKFLMGPGRPDSFVGKWTWDLFLQEIPPGSRSGKHLHMSEELHLILEGRGYDVQDGVRYDWKKDDLVCIPVGTVHQHFNTDSEKPAKFISVQPRYWAAFGFGGILQIEEAPECA
ncbi:MAG: cupin domain-containing protein [Deltaproteobacteria bacterium]|nr:cupin domain-containing protein [Deltaproteobacteria bacterium]